MAFRLRAFEELVEELGGVTKANKAIKDAGISVLFGMYDHGALEAVEAEPKNSNIDRTKKDYFTLSPTDGLGAIKAVGDAVGLDIVRHVYFRSNYVTFRNAKGQRSQVKVYTRSSWNATEESTSFTVTDYLRDNTANYYMFVCFAGTVGWVLSRADLVGMHKLALKGSGQSKAARIARQDLDNRNGRIRVYLGPEEHRFTSAAQVGL